MFPFSSVVWYFFSAELPLSERKPKTAADAGPKQTVAAVISPIVLVSFLIHLAAELSYFK